MHASTMAAVKDLVARSLILRAELAESGKRVDLDGHDTAEGLQRCFDEGLHRLSLPAEHGGLSNGKPNFATEAYAEIVTNLSAADSSLGQNWLTTQLVLRELYDMGDVLPASTLAEIGSRVANDNLRLVASNADTGSTNPMSAREVPGGIRVSGTKGFNSNSGGGGIAHVGFIREGFHGRFHALIPLDAEGVRPHRDWDNMGQRGTHSQMITYEDVFVPDGWHYAHPIDALIIPLAFMLHGVLVLGNGFGALDSALDHVRGTKRKILTRSPTSAEDALLMRRVGVASSRLQAALAFQRQVCRDHEAAQTIDELKSMTMDAMRCKTVSVETGVQVASDLFDLTGARTTANKYRFDRFWRNARTFACHDHVDVLYNWIGGWDLEGRDPDFFEQYNI
jgi:alkylation response protein AidB-like acyl-CoA dehydrogenase